MRDLLQLVPIFAFMLIPVWIPLVAMVCGAVHDALRATVGPSARAARRTASSGVSSGASSGASSRVPVSRAGRPVRSAGTAR